MKISHIIDEHFEKNDTNLSTGLINPSGRALECRLFGHLSCAKEHPDFLTEDLRDLSEMLNDRLEEVAEYCRESQENGDHPEWHAYEMAESDVNTEFLNALYKAGYLRFYIEFNFEKGQTFNEKQLYANVTLEGKRIEDHYDLINYLQNKYRVNLRICRT